MRNNHSAGALTSAAALIISLSALYIIASLAKSESIQNLLLVTPLQLSSPGIGVSRIEEFTDNNFLVTYEITSSDRVSLAYADFPVTVVATNSCYSQILGYNLTEGSFFSKQAWTARQRHAVLNETAAFSVFGSSRIAGNQFKIRGDTWLVTGIINDGDNDNSRVYIPSSVTGGQAGYFFALISEAAGISETYIKNSMKTLGIHETMFSFINLNTQIKNLYERACVTVMLFSGFLFVFLFLFFIGKFRNAFLLLKTEMKNRYIAQIFRENKKIVFKPLLSALPLLVSPITALFLFLRALSIILPWQDIVSLKGKQDILYPHIERINNYEFASRFLFIFSLLSLVLTVIIFLRRKPWNT